MQSYIKEVALFNKTLVGLKSQKIINNRINYRISQPEVIRQRHQACLNISGSRKFHMDTAA